MANRECLFCEFKIEADIRKTTADRLLAAHFQEYHAKEIEPLTASVELDRKLLIKFGDLIDIFEEDVRKRQTAIDLMSELSETFRQRIVDAERGIDRRLIESIKEVMLMPAENQHFAGT